MQRGARRQSIFVDDEDRAVFGRWADEAFSRFQVELHAWVMMDNHVHLLLHCPEGHVSEAMHLLGGSYAAAFNRRHGLSGSLFGGRFRSIVVGSHSYLVEVVRYIHRNPVAAGLVAHPSDYEWSSHHQYVSNGASSPRTCTGELLSYFDNDDERFGRFVEAPDSIQARHVLEAIETGAPALGPAEFIEGVIDDALPDDGTIASVRRLSRDTGVAEIEIWLAERLGAKVAELTRYRARESNNSLAMLLTILHEQRRCSLSDAALRYGYASRQTVASQVTRTQALAAADPALRALIDAAPARLRRAV